MSNDKLDELWRQAESKPGTEIDIGNIVVCDGCNDDYTNSNSPGGFIFLSRAICPRCASHWMASIIANGEQSMIRAACPSGQSFAEFVRSYRGPNTKISVGSMP